MITKFNYSIERSGERLTHINMDVDTQDYPLSLVIKCFKTQPPPPRYEPCFPDNRVVITPFAARFVTGPFQDESETFSFNNPISINSLSGIDIFLSSQFNITPNRYELNINIADVQNDSRSLSISI